jgi:hypothetical protein
MQPVTWVQLVAIIIFAIFGFGVVLLVLSVLVGNGERKLRIRWVGRACRASALLLAPVLGGLVLLIETPADLGVLGFALRSVGVVVIAATLIAGAWIARRGRHAFAEELGRQPKNLPPAEVGGDGRPRA